ncbi:aminoglycoside phosphotransferase family protein [Roseobacter sp. S98]|uniref:aminoglycoside phosphotransferase family protein n=1 Tax=Roseobacter algicola (ex Choi et al. 2025) (nom. illeg.) TaxID=3092138 RepID=UPI003F51591E
MAELTGRETLKLAFLTDCGWSGADRRPLAGDASNRIYERLRQPDGKRAVLMDAPPEKGEDVGAFARIARYLAGIDLSAPEIFAMDGDNGFLLIEDLGDDLFSRCIARDPTLSVPLYSAAVDVLSHLHRQNPPDGLARYEADTTVPLAALVYDWYVPGVTGSEAGGSRDTFLQMADQILRPYDPECTVLIQRDYHAENLLWLPERSGLRRVGLLDFQSAEIGHPVYDLVSVLRDARRDVSQATEALMKTRFVAQNGLNRDEFDRAYAVFGLQRNLRIMGGFSRLCMHFGKADYVQLIPRVWGHVQSSLEHPDLAELAQHIRATLPEPEPDALARLAAKVAA